MAATRTVGQLVKDAVAVSSSASYSSIASAQLTRQKRVFQRSTFHRKVAGVGSVLPAASVA